MMSHTPVLSHPVFSLCGKNKYVSLYGRDHQVRWFGTMFLLASLELVSFLQTFGSFHRRLVTILCECDATVEVVWLIWYCHHGDGWESLV
jgi:hypothetical protein